MCCAALKENRKALCIAAACGWLQDTAGGCECHTREAWPVMCVHSSPCLVQAARRAELSSYMAALTAKRDDDGGALVQLPKDWGVMLVSEAHSVHTHCRCIQRAAAGAE